MGLDVKLGVQTIRIESETLRALLVMGIPGYGDKHPSPKDRMARIAARTIMQWQLDGIDRSLYEAERRAIKAGVPYNSYPHPKCPRGADILLYGAEYLLNFLERLNREEKWSIRYRVNSDGSLTLTGLDTTPPDSGGGDDGPDPAGPRGGDGQHAEQAPERRTRDTREPVRRLVHSGRSG